MQAFRNESVCGSLVGVAVAIGSSCLRRFKSIPAVASDTRVVFVLGNAGVGKGTQCKILAKEFKCNHFSAGELLRRAIQAGGREAAELSGIIEQGKIVPAQVGHRLHGASFPKEV